jgi:hypothetical protein
MGFRPKNLPEQLLFLMWVELWDRDLAMQQASIPTPALGE